MRSDSGANIGEDATPEASPSAGSDIHQRQTASTGQFYEVDADRSNSISEAWSDLLAAMRKHRLWRQLATLDIKQKYSGSTLGPFWITATSGAFAVGIGIAYSRIFGIAVQDYLPYVGIGIVLWGAIISVLNDGTQVYISAAGVIKQVHLPLSLFIFKTVYRNLISFLYRAIVIVLLMITLKVQVGLVTLLSLAGVVLLFFTAIWTSMLLGILSVRFRDVTQVISALLTFSFFLTPIFWKAERLGEYQYLINFNPFYHFIEIIRTPLLGSAPDLINYASSCAICVLLCGLSLWLFTAARRRIPYWC